MKTNKTVLIMLAYLLSTPCSAFTCYLSATKDSCWLHYDVNLTVTDVDTSKTLLNIKIPSGKPWIQQSFDCEPSQRLDYQASFSPIFWQEDAGKVYKALRFWSLPAKAKPNELAWNIPICFPAAFSEVPLPPDAQGNCQCDFSQVPLPTLTENTPTN